MRAASTSSSFCTHDDFSALSATARASGKVIVIAQSSTVRRADVVPSSRSPSNQRRAWWTTTPGGRSRRAQPCGTVTWICSGGRTSAMPMRSAALACDTTPPSLAAAANSGRKEVDRRPHESAGRHGRPRPPRSARGRSSRPGAHARWPSRRHGAGRRQRPPRRHPVRMQDLAIRRRPSSTALAHPR